MARGRPNGIGARPHGVLVLWAAFALAAPGGARADARDPLSAPIAAPWVEAVGDGARAAGGPRLSLGLLAGTTQFDAGLADYQWDTTLRPGWGLQALIGGGRLAAGVRVWRAATTQSIGDLGAAPDVHATRWELIGEGRLLEALGTEFRLTAGAGRLRLAWDPDRIVLQPAGGGAPIEVALAPVGTWTGGAGFVLRRPLAADWTVGLGVDARIYAIDTARRSGDTVVLARERFGDWSTRLELAWWRGPR